MKKLPTEDTPPPTDIVWRWISRKIGKKATVVLAFIIVLLIPASKYWHEFRTIPYVASKIEHYFGEPIPKADPDRYSVLVAHLENDTNREFERLIIESLREVKEIQVLALDRTIILKGAVPENSEKVAYSQARQYLRDSGASVLIWGTIISLHDKYVPKLYWLNSNKWARKPHRYPQSSINNDILALPTMFWDDLKIALYLHLIDEYEQVASDNAILLGGNLPTYITKMQRMLESKDKTIEWNASKRLQLRFIIAKTYRLFGEQQGRYQYIDDSIEMFRKLLADIPGDYPPDYKADIQNELANALDDYSQYDDTSESLKGAIHLYNEAIKLYPRTSKSKEWAGIMYNIAHTQAELGKRERNAYYIALSIVTLFNAMSVIPYESHPQFTMIGGALEISYPEIYPEIYTSVVHQMGVSLRYLCDVLHTRNLYIGPASVLNSVILITQRESFKRYLAHIQEILSVLLSHGLRLPIISGEHIQEWEISKTIRLQ